MAYRGRRTHGGVAGELDRTVDALVLVAADRCEDRCSESVRRRIDALRAMNVDVLVTDGPRCLNCCRRSAGTLLPGASGRDCCLWPVIGYHVAERRGRRADYAVNVNEITPNMIANLRGLPNDSRYSTASLVSPSTVSWHRVQR